MRDLRLINVAGCIVAALVAVGLYRDNMHELGGMLQGAYITLLIVLLSSALALLMASATSM